MKKKLRNGLVGIMLAACITTWFTGCSTEPEPFDVTPVGPSTSISEVQPNAPDYSINIGDGPDATDTQHDMFMRYWYDASTAEAAKEELSQFKGANELTATDTSILNGLVDIMQAKDGTQYIISGFTPSKYTGKLSAKQIVTLRMAETGDRIYIMDSEAEQTELVSEINKFLDTLSRNNVAQTTNLNDREAAREEIATQLALLDKSSASVAINNKPTNLSFANGTLSVAELLDESMGVLEFVEADSSNHTVTLKVNAAASSFTVVFKGNADGTLALATADGQTINQGLAGCMIGNGADVQLYLTPEAVQSCLGFDVEVFGSINVVNIVTDQRDLFHTDNIVVDTPEQAQAEQSTQGAADKTQQQAPTSDQAIQQEVQKEQEATTPSKPANPDKWQPSNPQVNNPSQDDVNDLLNDILGGGGSTSKPSSSADGLIEGNQQIGGNIGGDGSDLGHAGTGSLDAWK